MPKPCFARSPKAQGPICGACRRRDRYPQNLDPFPSAGARRQPCDRGRDRRTALQVHTMGRQASSRNSAPARQTRCDARSQHVRNRLCRDGASVLEPIRAIAESRGHPGGGKFQISLPTPIAPTYNNMVPSDRPLLLPALTQHLIGEVAKIAAAIPTTGSPRNGMCVRKCWPGKAITRRDRRFLHRNHRCSLPVIGGLVPESDRSRLPLVLRQPGGRALRPA